MLRVELFLSLRRDEMIIIVHAPGISELSQEGTGNVFQGRDKIGDEIVGYHCYYGQPSGRSRRQPVGQR